MYRPVNSNVNVAPAFVVHVDVPSKSEILPPRVHARFCENTMEESRSSNTAKLMKYGCVEGVPVMIVVKLRMASRHFN